MGLSLGSSQPFGSEPGWLVVILGQFILAPTCLKPVPLQVVGALTKITTCHQASGHG